MRRTVDPVSAICLLSCLLIVCLIPASIQADTFRDIPSMDVYFSPRGGCTQAIVAEIEGARSEILIQAYSFTSVPIARALVSAHRRGVRVVAIMDRSQQGREYTSATFLVHAGISVYIDSVHAIAHNKIMIIDRKRVITGSFNFTKAAEERNAENLQIVRSEEVADLYRRNFDHHLSHSEFYR